MKTIKIGYQDWTIKNLDTLTFLNGDKIRIAKNAKQWQKAGANETPICSYYNYSENDDENLGVYYNYYCITDPRGLVDVKYKIPTIEDCFILLENSNLQRNDSVRGFDGNILPLFQTDILSLFKAIPAGIVSQWGSFFYKDEVFQCWTSDKLSEVQSYYMELDKRVGLTHSAGLGYKYENSAGCSIRLLLNT
jgi:hypothetical protein